MKIFYYSLHDFSAKHTPGAFLILYTRVTTCHINNSCYRNCLIKRLMRQLIMIVTCTSIMKCLAPLVFLKTNMILVSEHFKTKLWFKALGMPCTLDMKVELV